MTPRRGRPPAALAGTLTLALVTGTLGLAGCTLLVSDDPIRCQAVVGQPDPCPQERVCVSGYCVPAPACVPRVELCNGLDDDCDGRIDEGHDDDGDGFTWCGGGLLHEVDCDDTRADVHPGSEERGLPAAEEVCDSRDNDCDERVDEGADSLCDGNEACLPGFGCAVPDCTRVGYLCDAGDSCDLSLSPPACVPGVCTPGDCPDPLVCDTLSGSCVTPQPLDSPCFVDAQCAEGACVPARAITGAEGGICAKACCHDTHCSAERICWGAATGAKVCVLPGSVGTARGGAASGSACARSSECVSARCVGDVCRDTCSREARCDAAAEPASCALGESADIAPTYVFACVDERGGAALGEPCGTTPCASDLCVYRIEAGGFICLGACHTSDDCPDAMYCGNVVVDEGLSESRTRVQACEPRFHSGGDLSGAPCVSGWTCRDFACVGGRCADTCCSDANCPVGFGCEPVNRGGAEFEMRCVPR